MGQTYSPEVVDQDVEHTQQHNQHDRTPLGLESNNDHDTRDEAEQADNNAPETPLAGEDESDEEEDQQHTTSELDVHLAVLLIELGKTGGDELLAHPRVRENHEQATDNTQVAEEEVEVEDQSVTETLNDDDSQETANGVLRVSTSNDHERASRHCDHVDDKEGMRDSPGNCYATKPKLESICDPAPRRVRPDIGGTGPKPCLLFR